MQDRNVYGRARTAAGRPRSWHGVFSPVSIADEAGADADQAFLCGLLHDIGKMVILKWHYDHVKTSRRAQAMDATGRGVADALASRKWRASRSAAGASPSELDEPVLRHHDYTRQRLHRRMATVTYLANRLSHRYGFGCEPDGYDPLRIRSRMSSSLDADWLAEIDQTAPGLFAVARQALV